MVIFGMATDSHSGPIRFRRFGNRKSCETGRAIGKIFDYLGDKDGRSYVYGSTRLVATWITVWIESASCSKLDDCWFDISRYYLTLVVAAIHHSHHFRGAESASKMIFIGFMNAIRMIASAATMAIAM